ncbi:MAG TPA: choice-of-anchor P family protein [Acidimicrobiales bacterium]|jgi:hypothetical protein|nr:choice-of-anchor P family protein [Acidimicrobiales bacterium]
MSRRIEIVLTFTAVCAVLSLGMYAVDAGGVSGILGNSSSIGACSDLGGQSTVGGQSSVGGQSQPGCAVVSGRAFGLQVNATVGNIALVNLAGLPDTGNVVTEIPGSYGPPCVLSILPALLNANVLCANVKVGNDQGTSTASLASLSTTLWGVPNIVARAITASSTTSCTGSLGSMTIGYLAIGNSVLIAKAEVVKPNTVLSVGGYNGVVSVTLDQQKAFGGADHGLTVNALTVQVQLKPLVSVSVVIASATSDIAGC